MISCNIWFRNCTDVRWQKLEVCSGFAVWVNRVIPGGSIDTLTFFFQTEESVKKFVEIVEAEIKKVSND